MVDTARELGIGIVAYSPLGRGFLTGQITSPDDFPEGDFRAHLPRFTGDNFTHNIELVDKVRSLAADEGMHRRASWPWPGCSPGATTWCPSPAPSGAPTSRRTWRRWTWC